MLHVTILTNFDVDSRCKKNFYPVVSLRAFLHEREIWLQAVRDGSGYEGTGEPRAEGSIWT
jgi:hypothetical protein